MGVLRPIRLRITNWPSLSTEWLEAPLWPGGPQRRLPFGGELLIERDDFVVGTPPPGFKRLAVGSAVKLRFAYVVTCDSWREEGGEVVEVLCTYDAATRSQFTADGQTAGKMQKRVKVIHWVHESISECVALLGVPQNSFSNTHANGVSGGDLDVVTPFQCEPFIREFLKGNLAAHEGIFVHFERVGLVERIAQSDSLAVKWIAQRIAPTAHTYEQQSIAVNIARRAQPLKATEDLLSVSCIADHLLLICASERWAHLMALELQKAWCAAGREDGKLALVAQGLYWGGGPKMDGDNVGWGRGYVSGLRRELRLLCKAQASARELVEAVETASLEFPHGFSLEIETPCPARQVSTAPYVSSSAYLPAALSRVISGPLIELSDSSDRDSKPHAGDAGSAHARLVVLETFGPTRFLLAEDLYQQQPSPTQDFLSSWRLRPFPDYSAALEPLTALAIVNLGLLVHGARHVSQSASVFLDPTCGSGTVAAAARYCRGAAWTVFAGDVNKKMAEKTRANLEAVFPGEVRELDSPDGDSEYAKDVGAVPSQNCLIGVRQWDATVCWPLPSLAGLGATGAGLIVAANLPWGHAIRGREDDARRILLNLIDAFPQATLCLIISETLRRECMQWPSLHTLHNEPCGKKAALLIAHGHSIAT